MIINFIISGLFRSGGMRVIFEFANRFVKSGNDVTLYFPIIPYNFYKGQSTIRYNIRNHYGRFKDMLNQRNIINNLYPYDFKISAVPIINNVFIRDADANIATVWPTAYSVNNLSDSKGRKFYFIQDYETWNSNINSVDGSYKLPLKGITTSKYLNKLFMERFNINSKIICYGMNFSVFYNEEKVYSKGRKRILYIDHFREDKGSETAIQIIKRIKDKYDNVDILCFGLEKYHNFPNYVEFIKSPSDDTIRKLYCETDIFLFSSEREGFGLPPAEAMACKCAVVSTAVGAVPEYSINKETAILTNPDNPEELFHGICYLLDNEDELIKISNEGYKKVRRFFNWDRSAKEFEEYISR